MAPLQNQDTECGSRSIGCSRGTTLIVEQKDALREQLLALREALEKRSQASAQDAQPVSVDRSVA